MDSSPSGPASGRIIAPAADAVLASTAVQAGTAALAGTAVVVAVAGSVTATVYDRAGTGMFASSLSFAFAVGRPRGC